MPVLLVRHAVAVARRSWPGDDVDRPLDRRGHSQAFALVDALRSHEVADVRSSPAVRCIGTVQPLAAARRLEVVPDEDLLEGNGDRAVALVRDLLRPAAGTAAQDGPAAALCSHGDVIPEVLDALARDGADLGHDQRCQKGSTWVLHLGAGGVRGEYVQPPA